MALEFMTPHGQARGLIASLLKRSYADLVASDPEHWSGEIRRWEQYDRDVHDDPAAVGACVFLSCSAGTVVGFGSWDPRQAPELGYVGHNCVLPEFRGRGFGKEQLQEILCRLERRGVRTARTSTLSGAWHEPARRMYARCGFREIGRHPWRADPALTVIDYEAEIGIRSTKG